jgi:hypothetical protein
MEDVLKKDEQNKNNEWTSSNDFDDSKKTDLYLLWEELWKVYEIFQAIGLPEEENRV